MNEFLVIVGIIGIIVDGLIWLLARGDLIPSERKPFDITMAILLLIAIVMVVTGFKMS